MPKDRLLVNSKYLLKKFPGKGGWTYAEIPEVLQDKNNPELVICPLSCKCSQSHFVIFLSRSAAM